MYMIDCFIPEEEDRKRMGFKESKENLKLFSVKYKLTKEITKKRSDLFDKFDLSGTCYFIAKNSDEVKDFFTEKIKKDYDHLDIKTGLIESLKIKRIKI